MSQTLESGSRRKWWVLGLILAFVTTGMIGGRFMGGNRAPKSTDAPIEIDALLALVMEPLAAQGNYTVVHPRTWSSADRSSDDAKSRAYAKDEFRKRNLSVDELVDALFDRNKASIALSFPSDRQKGYVLDADGTYGAYFAQGGAGWAQWYKDHPQAKGMTTISIPVYDASKGLLLIYIGCSRAGLSGEGAIRAYEYNDGKLRALEWVVLWKS